MRLRDALIISALVLAAGCRTTSGRPPLPAPPSVAEPAPSDVETIVFFLGDAGEARSDRSPTLLRVTREVEAWSCRLARDSAVAVVFLGDNVYPRGLHAPGEAGYDADTTYLNSQIRVIGGPCARRYRSPAFFIAGNHDWGQEEAELGGLEQLRNQERHIDAARQAGALVELRPRAGEGGPEAVDIGRRLRILFLDTAWWMLEANQTEKALIQGRIFSAMNTAGSREVVIVGHHPFESGGPHGGARSFWGTLGVEYLLSKSGAWLQDLHSGPYRDLLAKLRYVFRVAGKPLLYAGGHEHSLQVLHGVDPDDPPHILVSGSASKVTKVGFAPGQVFRHSAPGFGRLVFRRSGPVDMYVESTTDEGTRFLACDIADDAARAKCMEEGAAALHTIYSERLEP